MSLLSWPVARSLARQRARSVPIAAAASLWVAASAGGAALTSASPWQGGGFLLLLFAAALGEGLISEEVASGHAQLILMRPLTRAAWFGGRLLGALLLGGAAVGLVSLAALLGGLAAGGPHPLLLALSLPFAWVDLAAWLAVLAAVSVVARGLRNAAALALAALGWFALRAAAFQASAKAPWLGDALDAVRPWLHPHDARSIAGALWEGRPPDWGALAWNLVWIAAWWAGGAALLARVELARRRA